MNLARKIYLFVICIFLATIEVYAQPNPVFFGNAGSEVNGTYTVTIKKIEISQDGSNWVTEGEGSRTFNIALGNVGSQIGNYASNASIPPGTYLYIRNTLSRTMTIKGYGTYSGTTYYTSMQNGTVGTNPAFWKATTDSNKYEAVSFQVPADAQGGPGETLVISGDDMISTRQFPTPVVIGAGHTVSIEVSFNTRSMIGFESTGGGDYVFYPMPPVENPK